MGQDLGCFLDSSPAAASSSGECPQGVLGERQWCFVLYDAVYTGTTLGVLVLAGVSDFGGA